MQKLLVIISFLCLINTNTKQKTFTGKWTSEGDITAVGLLNFDLKQKKSKIEGTADYIEYKSGESTGILSVNGYVKKNIAYIRFRNLKMVIIADGTLKISNGNLNFVQTTKSNWLPKKETCSRKN